MKWTPGARWGWARISRADRSDAAARSPVRKMPACAPTRPLARIAKQARSAGAIPARKFRCGIQPMESSTPPMAGPTIEPTRPLPEARGHFLRALSCISLRAYTSELSAAASSGLKAKHDDQHTTQPTDDGGGTSLRGASEHLADELDGMAHLRHRLRRVCLRYLHAARFDPHRAARAQRNAAGERGRRDLQSLGGNSLLRSGDCRRRLRAARRLSDRPGWPPAHPGVEHPALWGVHLCHRLRDQPYAISIAALRDVYRRVGGICCSHGMAGGAIYAARAARSHHWYYASICFDGWPPDQFGLLPRRHLQPAVAIDSRQTPGLALRGDVWAHPSDSPDPVAAIPSRIAGLEAQESRGDIEAPELRGTLPAVISKDGSDYLPDDGLLVRRIVWHAAAFRPHNSRHARNPGAFG